MIKTDIEKREKNYKQQLTQTLKDLWCYRCGKIMKFKENNNENRYF